VSRQTPPKKSVRPDVPGQTPPNQSNPYPDIPKDGRPDLIGGPATESIPGTSHGDPLGPLARRKAKSEVALPKENDGGERSLSGRSTESGGERL
jgi:hypothetical protein